MNFVEAVDRILPLNRPIGHHDQLYPHYNASLVKDLEHELADYCGVRQALGVSSGTAALHLGLLAAGIKPGEEVLVPSLTYAATANAVRYCGAIPHFIDGKINVNHFKLRVHLANNTTQTPDRRGRLNSKTNRVISALIVVDLLGFPADMPKLAQLAQEFDLTLIEDASQALGSTLGGQKCGSFGAFSVLSFNTNKIVTGNGGGALLTNDEWIAARSWHLANVGRVPHAWKVEHDAIGFNYRMVPYSAFKILEQLHKIDSILAAKKRIFEMYKVALEHCDEMELLEATEYWQGTPNYWLTTALLKDPNQHEAVMNDLTKRGIGARALFKPLHTQSIYDDCPRMLNMLYSESVAARAVCLPSGLGLAQ